MSFGMTLSAFAQYPDFPESADLWREWMSVLQREPSMVSGPRLYLMTDRVVLQTSPDRASFQSGSYRMILADGSVPDVDGDADYYTDIFENGNGYADRDNPLLIPLGGNPPLPLPTDAFPILMADGTVLGISRSTLLVNTQANLVRNGSGSAVRIVAAPYSNLKRPVSFRDFSSQFYYYYINPGQTEGVYRDYPLSLYTLEKNYLSPDDGNSLETSIEPGVYNVEFPTIFNAPTGKSNLQVAHRLVPNGSLTRGLQKPTWLIRSLNSIEKDNVAPIAQKWVNGSLKFDSYLPLTLTWDDIVATGLASSADYIEITVEDDLLGQVSYTFRVSAINSFLSLRLADSTKLIYGSIAQRIARSDPRYPALHEPIKANIVMKYFRYANRQSSADLSSVTVRVPVEMTVTYNSWRKELFPGNASNDSISGPNADPDGDGLSNQQEYDQATNPTVATIGISAPTRTEITFNSATLGGTVKVDPTSTNVISERGVVYSRTSSNNNPLIGGFQVLKGVSPGTDGVFTVNVTGLAPNTAYSFKAYVTSTSGTSYTTVSTFTTLGTPVTTPTFANITVNAATLGATVSGSGFTIYERGVVYSASLTNPIPVLDGPGVSRAQSPLVDFGTYTVPVTGLNSGTQYSFSGYVVTDLGTFYSAPAATFTTLPAPPVTPPIVTTPTSSGVTSVSATLGGDITNAGNPAFTERGVVYSPIVDNSDPFLGDSAVLQKIEVGSAIGVFTTNVTGLLPETVYAYRAYAINAVGTSHTIDAGTFTTLPAAIAPSIISPTVTNITAVSAILGGEVTGGSAVIQRGVVFSLTATNPNPLMAGTGVVSFGASSTGTGVFTVNATNLSPGKNYSYKAYAMNSQGTSYTAVGTFTTSPTLPAVTSLTLASVTSNSAVLGANVSYDGDSPILERGFIYSKASVNGNPVIGGLGVTKVSLSGATGAMSSSISGLLAETGYVFKGYAINAVGVGYSVTFPFTTPQILVSNPTATSITVNSVTLGGTVSGPAASSITERGVVYSVFSANPSPVIGGVGVSRLKNPTNLLGAFTVPVTGLVSATKYAYSAYVITAAGTFYSSPASNFTTLTQPPLTLPTVITPNSAAITTTTATLGGNVSNDGGSPITARGVVYSVKSINDNPFILGTGVTRVLGTVGTGVFTISATALIENTTYSFRAYATNSLGTSYTAIGTFTTATITLATIVSPTVASVTVNSAVLGADLVSNGNSSITERGVVYALTSVNSNPQVGGAGAMKVIVPGTATGVFSSNVPGLTANRAYTFRGYAINTIGTSYTTAVGTFTTATTPTIVSPTVTGITSTSATLGGNITSDGGAPIVGRGVVFSLTATNGNPLFGGIGVTAIAAPTADVGVFTVEAGGLTPGKLHSFKAYAVNGGVISYTPMSSFTTAAALVTITSPSIRDLTTNSATLGATVVNDTAALSITQRGFIYSQTSVNGNPVVGGPGVTQLTVSGTTGSMLGSISGLLGDTGYTFKAYATNSAGIAYAAPFAFFTTFPTLTVTSPTFADVTSSTATLGGTVVSDGGTTVSSRGIVLSLNPSVAPVIGGAGVSNVVGSGTMGLFTVPVTGLATSSDYYFRAYATNTTGTSYSSVSTFRTQPLLLLGQAQMQWAPAPQPSQMPALSLQSPPLQQAAVAASPAQAVPQFIYLKDISERADQRAWIIEISSDNKEWLPIDERVWLVTETTTEIKAVWNSTTSSPPTRLFFRIKAQPAS